MDTITLNEVLRGVGTPKNCRIGRIRTWLKLNKGLVFAGGAYFGILSLIFGIPVAVLHTLEVVALVWFIDALFKKFAI